MEDIPIYRCALVKDSSAAIARTRLRGPADAASVAKLLIGDQDREAVLAIFLDNCREVIGAQIVSLGALDQAISEPREIFKAAILAGAKYLVLAHNHPSGHAVPSPEDRLVTQRLIACGCLIGIEVVDHLVLGDGDRFTSLRAEGEIDWLAARQLLNTGLGLSET